MLPIGNPGVVDSLVIFDVPKNEGRESALVRKFLSFVLVGGVSLIPSSSSSLMLYLYRDININVYAIYIYIYVYRENICNK